MMLSFQSLCCFYAFTFVLFGKMCCAPIVSVFSSWVINSMSMSSANLGTEIEREKAHNIRLSSHQAEISNK